MIRASVFGEGLLELKKTEILSNLSKLIFEKLKIGKQVLRFLLETSLWTTLANSLNSFQSSTECVLTTIRTSAKKQLEENQSEYRYRISSFQMLSALKKSLFSD